MTSPGVSHLIRNIFFSNYLNFSLVSSISFNLCDLFSEFSRSHSTPRRRLQIVSRLVLYVLRFNGLRSSYWQIFIIALVTDRECTPTLIPDKNSGSDLLEIKYPVTLLLSLPRTESSPLINQDVIQDEVLMEFLIFGYHTFLV